MAAIIGWGATFAPRDWAFCHGQLLAISSNTALFSLLGTTYGGDGRTTFALPELRGRAPIGAGQSPGTSFWPQGARAGSETETLTQAQMPLHNHTATTAGMQAIIPVATGNADETQPSNTRVLATSNAGLAAASNIYTDASNADTNLAPGAVSGSVTIGNAGASQPFSIVQPISAIQFIIAVQGIYPSRN